MKTGTAVFFSIFIALLSASVVFGQRGGGGAPGAPGAGAPGGGGPGGASGGGIPGAPGPGRTSFPSTNTQPGMGTQGIQAPIFLSGKVVMADGSPLPPGIVIQRICQGNPHTVGYADGKGNFSFQWGNTMGVTPDASESGGGSFPGAAGGGLSATTAGGGSVRNMTSPAGMPQMGGSMDPSIGACELLANVPGYTSTTVNLFMHRAMDNPDVGRIVLHRNTAVEGTSISATSLTAPKDARKAFGKGLEALHKNKQADAEKNFEKAVSAYPQYADAWVELGRIRLANKQVEPARAAFKNAMQADGKLVAPWVELGVLAAQDQNWKDSAQFLDKAVRLDPIDFPMAWYVDAVANFNLKNLAAAEKSVREAVKMDPQHRNPRADYLLGLVLMEKRDYTGAAAELKNYLAMSPSAENHDAVQKQIDQIEKLQPAALH